MFHLRKSLAAVWNIGFSGPQGGGTRGTANNETDSIPSLFPQNTNYSRIDNSAGLIEAGLFGCDG